MPIGSEATTKVQNPWHIDNLLAKAYKSNPIADFAASISCDACMTFTGAQL